MTTETDSHRPYSTSLSAVASGPHRPSPHRHQILPVLLPGVLWKNTTSWIGLDDPTSGGGGGGVTYVVWTVTCRSAPSPGHKTPSSAKRLRPLLPAARAPCPCPRASGPLRLPPCLARGARGRWTRGGAARQTRRAEGPPTLWEEGQRRRPPLSVLTFPVSTLPLSAGWPGSFPC